MSPPSSPPDGATLTRTTPEFDQDTVPAGLLKAHKISDGVWGRLVVRSGELRFTFDSGDPATRAIAAGDHVVIPPLVPHHVTIDGLVQFVIEFHRSG
jgi:tellurite resistance-related uncharacterized protein